MSIDQEPPYLLQQAPSCYEVLCSIENALHKREIITHGTCEIDPSSLTGQMQNEERHVTHILHTSSESFEAESSTSSVIQPAMKKKRKKKNEKKI